MPRPRKRALGMIGGAGLLFFLGTNVQAGWLFVLAACLLGVVVAGIVLPGRMVRGLEIDRRAPEEVHQGDEVLVELGVRTRGRGMRLGVLADDAFLEPTTIALASLAPGERVEVATLRRARRRGPQGGVPVTLRSSAPFGISERKAVREAAGAQTLVLPTVVALGTLPFVRSAATSDHAIHTAPRRGRGPEYLGIRAYRPGDSMRHVHWPSTARTGAVMVREFEEEQTRRLAIVVDSSWDVGETWTPLDRICAAAASVAMAALAQGHGARLILPGGDGAEVLARADAGELMHRLARLTPHASMPFGDLVGTLGDELRGVETAVLVFVARRGNDPVGLAASVAALADRLAHVVALAVDVTADESPQEALAPGAWTRLEEGLRRAGAEVYPWRAGDDLAAVLSPDAVWGVGAP